MAPFTFNVSYLISDQLYLSQKEQELTSIGLVAVRNPVGTSVVLLYASLLC